MGYVMYESGKQAPLARPEFAKRLLGHAAFALGLIAISLAIGMLGYMGLENLTWIDAFLNSAMLLGGMGPVNVPQTAAGKLFAGTRSCELASDACSRGAVVLDSGHAAFGTFVSGIPEMIDTMVAHIPNAEKGFRLLFASEPFPGYQVKLEKVREEM